MSRTVLKKLLVVSLAVLWLSLYTAPASAGGRHGCKCKSGCCCCSECCPSMSCCGMNGGASFVNGGTSVGNGSGCGCSGAVLDSSPVQGVDRPTPAPARTPPPAPIPVPRKPTVPSSTSIEPARGGLVVLTVSVPYDAKVTINGKPTKSTGNSRQFFCDGLLPGYTYTFEVKAEVVRNGKAVTEMQTVSPTAGEEGRVALRFNIPGIEGLAAAK